MKRVALLLAVLLQLMPLCRVALMTSAAAPSTFSIVFSWVAATAALLGSYDAVSGASSSVSGVVEYDGGTPVGSVTNQMVEPVGEVFKYRITVTNPGVDYEKNYFNCFPLPPGLTINTNIGTAGYITGVPTVGGTYPVTLLAGNLNYPTPSTMPATIVIYPPDTPPVITEQPTDRSIVAGSTYTFSVGVEGSLPLSYQWFHNGEPLPEADEASLTLADITTTMAGDYHVVVTNLFGSVTSSTGDLTVREPFLLEVRLSQASRQTNGFAFVAIGPIFTNYVVWRSPDLIDWSAIQTNWVIDGFLQFTDPTPPVGSRHFYRVSFGEGE